MNRVFSHIKRLFRKFWFFLFIAFMVSPIIGLGTFIVAIAISMALFNDPVDAKDPADYFTEEELTKMQGDDKIDDEEYLMLLAKYLTYECPVKVDEITTWTSSEVTKDSFIYNYEINDRWHKYGEINMDVMKNKILTQMTKSGSDLERIIATKRNIIYRYWNLQTGTFEDVVISTDELRS